MRRLIPFLMVVVCAATVRANDHISAFQRAAAHSDRIKPDKALRARYMWRPPYSLDPKANLKELEIAGRLDNAWRNFLSRESEIGRIDVLGPDLVAIYLDEYTWTPELWEKMLPVEPWFHERVLAEKGKPVVVVGLVVDKVWVDRGNFIQIPIAELRDGEQVWEEVGLRTFRRSTVKGPRGLPAQPKKPDSLQAQASWIDAKSIATLILRTQSQVPLVRADWFLSQTSQQEKREVGYYDWLGIKTLQDWRDLSAGDAVKSRKLKQARRFVVRRSTVTRYSRAGEGGNTLTGGVEFLTEDFDDTVDVKNPLRLLNRDAKRAGGEGLNNLSNGLIGMIVVNAEDKRLDAVPPNIASDSTSKNPDRQVLAGRCMGCHQGFNEIADWARNVYVAPFDLESPDPKLEKELRSAYLSDIKAMIGRGNALYAASLKGFGFTPVTFSLEFRKRLTEYEEADVDFEVLERWTGLTKLRDKFDAEAGRYKKGLVNKRLDPIFAAMLQGIPARVEHIEELVSEIYRIGRIP